jgi:argininosuccinate lyase
MTHAEVNRERMRRRACESFLTVTELADTLVREEGISFPTAHCLVAAAVRAAGRDSSPERLVTEVEGLAPKILGRELRQPRDAWLRVLNPEYFVSIRRIPGGPALEAVQAQIAAAHQEQKAIQEWQGSKGSLLERYPQIIRDDVLTLKNSIG